MVHDYGHVGLTNDFLAATSDPLALQYNDHAPLENHHCAAAFSALQQPELNFTKRLPRDTAQALRKQVRVESPCMPRAQVATRGPLVATRQQPVTSRPSADYYYLPRYQSGMVGYVPPAWRRPPA